LSTFDLSNFLASFYDEARERLASIDHSLVKFEDGSLDAEGLIALKRDAHTIKGSALMLGVIDVGAVAHLFEDAMENVIEHPDLRTHEFTSFLYQLHDELAKRIRNPDDESIKLDADILRAQYKELELKISSGDNEHSKSINITVKKQEPEQQLIGVDDAASWKQKPKVFQSDFDDDVEIKFSAIEEFVDETPKAVAVEQMLKDDIVESTPKADAVEQMPKVESVEQEPKIEPLESMRISSARGMDDFAPDISHMGLQQTAQKKSSGRFLRVDSQRIEDLSSFVVELSSQSSNQEAGNPQSKIIKTISSIADDWKKVNSAIPVLDEQQRMIALDAFNDAMEDHLKHIKQFKYKLEVENENKSNRLKDLRNQVFGLMLRPIDNIFSAFPRSVRDTASRMNKKVKLQIGGNNIEIDQSVSEMLVEPLVHLLNNSVAHGIELPDDRIAINKPAVGTITILARQNGNEIIIEVMDDGAGLDPDEIKRVAVEKGVTTQAEADLMNSAGLMEMIFRPGFSTKKDIDTVSGRGIGMNVVQDVVRKLTGSIRIHSVKGKGTRFIISLPLSIAVQNALIFRAGSRKFGILSHLIEQNIPLLSQNVTKEAGKAAQITYGNSKVPLVDMRTVLNDNSSENLSKNPYIVITEHIEGFVGMIVDELIDNVEIVVKELDPYLKRYQPQGVMGNTISADGSVVLLLEPYGIKEMGRTAPDIIDVENIEETFKYKVLLAEDSLIAREVEKAAFERLGFVVETAIDGMNALEKLNDSFDLIVSDLEMPRLDGFGLVRRIRNREEYDNIPIIIISSRESPEDRMRALEAGSDSYLVKQHLNGDNLLSTLQTIMGSIVE